MYEKVAGVVLDSAGRIALIESRMDSEKWSLPGGKVVDEERMSDTLMRELREELGISVMDMFLFDMFMVKSNIDGNDVKVYALQVTYAGTPEAQQDGRRVTMIDPLGVPAGTQLTSSAEYVIAKLRNRMNYDLMVRGMRPRLAVQRDEAP